MSLIQNKCVCNLLTFHQNNDYMFQLFTQIEPKKIVPIYMIKTLKKA
jgi:hypothetical protein